MKEVILKFRIDGVLKDKFLKKCRERRLVPSKILRNFVKDFVENDK